MRAERQLPVGVSGKDVLVILQGKALEDSKPRLNLINRLNLSSPRESEHMLTYHGPSKRNSFKGYIRWRGDR